ncbi:MAG: peptide chain release factor 1 [Zestosphaera tikiterensis]|uniref:Peptide chain release factor subunit 1 n=1 Tax=Zestosphaera tikiterensis TaxID=1973259 RepID=A0A2R7Y3U0_9CREN|nr:MAG: peptide chain release factor 1 [Zestosphaera tikiterensis]
MSKEELKRIVKSLKTWEAHATTLLSLYIPPGRPIADVVNTLRQELSITENIKLKQTRSKVQTALEAAIDRLLKIPKTPPNGLVIFSGENDKTGEIITLVLEPPEPVNVFFYRTDKHFHTEFLEDMIEESNVYGLVIIERDEATIGLLKGNSILVLDEIEGYIPGKHSKGGWSQRRYDRIIEELTDEFHKSVAEKMNNYFLPYLEQGRLKGILVGGPGYVKNDFVKNDSIDYRLKSLIIPELIDVSSQGFPGLRELVVRAKDLLKQHTYIKTYDLLEEVKTHLAKDDGYVTYGEKEIIEALNMGAVRHLIIVEDHPRIEELSKKAEEKGAEVLVINSEIPEYEWLKKTFAGVIALLRYPIIS